LTEKQKNQKQVGSETVNPNLKEKEVREEKEDEEEETRKKE
jgi:hypothetical protein